MTFWRLLFILTALSGFLAVLLGAAGGHALAPKMLENGPARYEMAGLYHMSHSLALLACCLMGLALEQAGRRAVILQIAALFFLLGILLFSGNLYLRAFHDPYPLGALVPVGGSFLMAGWLMLALGVLCLPKRKRGDQEKQGRGKKA